MGQPAKDTKELVAEYLALWEKADIARLMNMYSDTVLYHDMTSGSVVKFADLEHFLSETFSREAGSSLHFNDVIYPKDDSVLLHWTQNLHIQGQKEPVAVGGVELIVFENGKIVSVHEFYDYRETADSDVESASTDAQAHDEQLSKLGLGEGDLKNISSIVTEYFETKRPFLDSKLNLATVADTMGYTRNQVSYVINHVIGCSFYEYVNKHRVNYVIDRMGEAGPNFSVVKIAIEAGFNTISGFYNAFKKQTGVTPSVYRKNALKAGHSVRSRADD
ncbi:MAG: helix-turn-helix domain-containing protein [Pseudomonadota bacterium]